MTSANKDESVKCLLIARKALEAGDVSKAVRFAEKAARLHPGPETNEFLVKVRRAASQRGATPSTNGTNNNAEGPAGMGSAGLRQRQQQQQPRSKATSSTTVDEDHKATPEQRTLVASIRSKTCYYEILGVVKSATDDDIKRAYRKLALKLHPDKNKARGADEAFKAVSRAFTCLSDPDKRRHYDVTGGEIGDAAGGQGGGFAGRGFPGNGGFGPFYEDEIDPEQIFRMFFGGNPFMAPTAGVYTGFLPRRRQQAGQERARAQTGVPEAPMLKLLASLAPLLLIILLQLVSRPTPRPFSLEQSRAYPTPVTTTAHGVPYFVRSEHEFATKFPTGSRERSRIELTVESEWRNAMQHACYQEQLLKKRLEYYGKWERAAAVPLTSCHEVTYRFGGGVAAGA